MDMLLELPFWHDEKQHDLNEFAIERVKINSTTRTSDRSH